MKSIALIAVALINAGLAAPVADWPFSLAHRSTPEVANFDDLPTSIETPTSTIPVPYNGLNFINFAVQPPGLGGKVPGVKPNSLPNYVSNGPRRRLTNGNPSLSIAGTKTPSFTLSQFYYGCLLSTEVQQAHLSTTCSFNVMGYKTTGPATVGPKSFTFTPSNDTEAAMALATFDKNSWTELGKVELQLTGPAAMVNLTVLVADTFKYRI